jgi:hypothetical protein
MNSSRTNHQLSLGPLPLRNTECAPTRAADDALRVAEQVTAELIDAAFTAARLENKVAAADLGKSVSLIEKWRSAEQIGSPSFVQLWMLGTLHPQFGFELNRAINKRCGSLTRQALASIIADLGAIAAAVGR